MNELLTSEAAIACLPVAVYLGVVSVTLVVAKRVPLWLHPVGLVGGLLFRVLSGGWVSAAVPLAVGSAVFMVLVLLAGRTVSGVTLFSLSVTLMLTPFLGWPGILMGLLAAAVVACFRTWRNLGAGRVAWLAMDTMSAVGVSPAGTIKRPDLGLIPERSVLTNVNVDTGEASKLRMYLPPYLLMGVGFAFLVLYFS